MSRAGLLGKDVVGLTEGERAQRRKQLAGGTDISGNQLRTCLACDARCGGVEFVDARVGPGELEAIRAEGVGRDAVASRFDVAAL